MIAEATTAEHVLASVPDDDGSTTATVERYYVEANMPVRPGDPVALLRSARYVFDIPAQTDGEVLELLVPEGAEVVMGSPLLRLQPGGLPGPKAQDSAVEQGRVHATPLARKIALLHGYALETVSGSGAGGCIRAADIRSLLPHSVPTTQQPLDELRSRSSTFPSPAYHEQVYPSTAPSWDAQAPRELSIFEVDMHQVVHAAPCDHERLERRGIKITASCRVVYAIIEALREHRMLNSRWTDNGILLYCHVHLGWVMEACDEVMTIPNADDLSLAGLARALAPEARSSSRAGTFQMSSACHTFTIVTNGGTSGWWAPPSFSFACGAILRLGATERRAVVIETPTGAAIAVRERAIFTLACDARYLSFNHAGAFMSSVRRRVEQWREIC